MKEKRAAVRYNVDVLPENLKHFLLDASIDKDVMAETYDASSMGIGLSLDTSVTIFSINDHIILKSLNNDFRLVGKIRYVYDRGPSGSRIGLEFRNTKSLELYRSLLGPLVEKEE
jgi:hypothetical protein